MATKKKKPALPSPAEKPKRLQEYQQDRLRPLEFFDLLLPDEKHYSNTIELYDFIPKYFWGKARRVEGKYLDPIEREFECRGRRYLVTITPARLKDKDGVYRDYYPSKREELIEDALRKLASEGQSIFLDDAAAVTFTLHQLQQELKQSGHSYSKTQIKEALLICAQTGLSVTTADNSGVLFSNVFETLGLQTRAEWQSEGGQTRAFVRFNSLVTQSIKRGTFRRFNYEKSMTYKSVIARQLHKRMAHHFTQSSITHPYHILLSTLIRDCGLTTYPQLRDNLRDVQAALDEMAEKDVLISYTVEKTIDAKRHNKLLDAKFILLPHPRFSGEVMDANQKQRAFVIASQT